MEGKIKVRLLGSPQVEMGDEAVKFPYRKTEGIFYYICVKKQVTRDELVSMFWADSDEKAGRKSVRQVLYQMKKCLGEDILIAEGHSKIELNPERAVEIDWDLTGDAFLRCEGEFLHCFYIKDCPEMEDWTGECRERQRERCREEVHRQLTAAERKKDHRELQRLIRLWIGLEPLAEDAAWESMDLLARTGQYNLAVQTFYDYRDRLMDELEEEPGDGITQAFRRIYSMKEQIEARGGETDLSFLGRFDELYQINEQVKNFENGDSCRSVVICGNMGVGKTALMEQIYRSHKGDEVLSLMGHVYQADMNFYLRAWCGIFKQLEQLHENGDLYLEEAEQRVLKQLLHGTSDQGETQAFVNVSTFPMLENCVTNMFRRLGEDVKILIYLDDIQWLDAVSSQLLLHLIGELGNSRLLLIASCRSTDENAEDLLYQLERQKKTLLLELAPFSREETEDILKQHFDENEMPITAEELYHRTEGNALILMDLLDAIKEEGRVPEKLPDRTGQALAPQLRNLTEEENQLLKVLSVFMESADMDEIRVLMPLSPLEIYDILESLQKKHLIRESTLGDKLTYGLRHRAYQDYIYQSQSLGKRRIWHQMVAEYYETRKGMDNWFELLPFLIYQYERSGNKKKADQYRVQYYCEFFALSNENFPVLQSRMEYDEAAGGISGNEAEILELARHFIDENVMSANLVCGECNFLLGRGDIARGNYSEGLQCIRRAIDIAGKLDNRQLLLASYRQMIFYGIQVDDRPVMKEYIDKGLASLDAAAPGSDYATFLRLKGLYHYRCGELEKAEEDLERSISIFTSLRSSDCHYQLSRAAAYNYLGRIHMKRASLAEEPEEQQEQYRQAEKLFRQAMEVGVSKYVTNGMGQFRANLGYSLLKQGKVKDAEKYLRAALECFKINGFFWGWDRAEALLCLTCLRLGLKSEAAEHLAAAERMIPVMGNPSHLALLEECRAAMKK